MKTPVGTFAVADIFHITGRGLVLSGELQGQVAVGHQLVFEDATHLGIIGVNSINLSNRQEKTGLLIDAPVASRQALQDGIIGRIAQIIAS